MYKENECVLRAMQVDDAEAVFKIYDEGIATGQATFEAKAPDWKKWDSSHISQCRWVTETAKEMLGWAALSSVSTRKVYTGVAEVSIYISRISQKKGIGSILLERLITSSEEAGLWTLKAQIFPENTTSIRLHEIHGFLRNGTRERIGLMTNGPLAGKWRDVVLLERRSQMVGV